MKAKMKIRIEGNDALGRMQALDGSGVLERECARKGKDV